MNESKRVYNSREENLRDINDAYTDLFRNLEFRAPKMIDDANNLVIEFIVREIDRY